MKPDTSVIISTYNSPEWLEKVLHSYLIQSYRDFEIVIADDGSGVETKELIDKFRISSDIEIRHVWHEDNGFQKTIILNKAIVESQGRYLIFSDGDCIARKDFIDKHIAVREPGYFLSGGYFKLPMSISNDISVDDIQSQTCFDIDWLRSRGLKSSFKNNKLTSFGVKEKFLNAVTPTSATWNGHNASGWRSDILEANGFDERMQYGGEDRELGERLFNAGIKSKQIRYSAICLHLDHARGYVKPEMIQKNRQIRESTKKNRITRTEYGIQQHAVEDRELAEPSV